MKKLYPAVSKRTILRGVLQWVAIALGLVSESIAAGFAGLFGKTLSQEAHWAFFVVGGFLVAAGILLGRTKK